MEVRKVILRSGMLFCAAALLLSLLCCSSSLKSKPLTVEEQRFVGSWQHIHGFGNVWNKDFQQDRNLHSYSTNLILGSREGYYLWEADGASLSLYDSDNVMLHLEFSHAYSFNGDAKLVIDGDEYTKQ